MATMVGAIETRSLSDSLAAAQRGFTFYVADPADSHAKDSANARTPPVIPSHGGGSGGDATL